MLKSKIVLIFFCSILLIGLGAFTLPENLYFNLEDKYNQSNDELNPSYCSTENTAFQSGEEVTYQLYYNWNFVWMSAGEVTFHVSEEKNNYHVSVKGRTYPSYEWFYKVRDNYDTYIEKNTLLPTLSVRDINEGSYKLYDKVHFDQNNKLATSWRGDNAKETVKRTFKLGDCMHDMVSMIYFARNIDYSEMKKGATFPVKVFLDKDIYAIDVKYKGKESNKNIKESGKYNTILFSPNVMDGSVFKEGSAMNIWVSDDENKIPLLIESPLSVGSVKAVLKSYKGLKHPFKAKQK